MNQDIGQLRELAARLLITPSAVGELSFDDALQVVDRMRLRVIEAGTVFVREGESAGSDHMLLILDGELSVENTDLGQGEADMVVRLMGPGSLIGELGLLDGAPRSASCVAHTDILAAELGREALVRLIEDDPRVGARLLLAIAKRMADHLRDATRRLRLFTQMNRALSRELTPPAPTYPAGDSTLV